MKHQLFSTVDKALGLFGYRLVRYPKVLQAAPEAALTLGITDAIAHHAIHNRTSARPLHFIQVGAYETKEDEKIVETVRMCGDYMGILIDPQPTVMARLRSRYAEDPRIHLLQAAVGVEDGREDFFYVDNSDNSLPAWTEQLASFSRAHIETCGSRVNGLKSRVVQTTVDVVSFKTLLERFRLRSLDLLICDTEGHDYELLKAFPFHEVVPRILQFEHAHLSAQDRNAAFAFLIGRGYRLAIGARDTLAIQR